MHELYLAVTIGPLVVFVITLIVYENRTGLIPDIATHLGALYTIVTASVWGPLPWWQYPAAMVLVLLILYAGSAAITKLFGRLVIGGGTIKLLAVVGGALGLITGLQTLGVFIVSALLACGIVLKLCHRQSVLSTPLVLLSLLLIVAYNIQPNARRDIPAVIVGMLTTAVLIIPIRVVLYRLRERRYAPMPGKTDSLMKDLKTESTKAIAKAINCSKCARELEYLGNPLSMSGPTSSVSISSNSMKKLEQWRGNVCVDCRLILCPICITVGVPTPCPQCKQPTKPAQRAYVEQVLPLDFVLPLVATETTEQTSKFRCSNCNAQILKSTLQQKKGMCALCASKPEVAKKRHSIAESQKAKGIFNPRCGKCGVSEAERVQQLKKAEKMGEFIYMKDWPYLLYCENCDKYFCGVCEIDLGMNAGCSECQRDLEH